MLNNKVLRIYGQLELSRKQNAKHRRNDHVPREKYRINAYKNLVRVPFNETITYKTTTAIRKKKGRTVYRRNETYGSHQQDATVY
jgi:hypothetical protein